MIHTMLKIIIFLLVSIPNFSKSHEIMSLASPHFPPYTYEHNQEIVGIGPDLIKRVLSNAKIPYKIIMVEDYGAGVHVVKTKLADGMFLASQNSERDAIATFTKPLIINKWSWFMLKDSKVDLKSESFKQQAGIGTIKGTNTFKWLKKNGYTILAQPLDAFSFVAEAVFEHELDEQELSQFKKVVEVEKPFGMYISFEYLKSHPDSLEKINRSIVETIH